MMGIVNVRTDQSRRDDCVGAIVGSPRLVPARDGSFLADEDNLLSFDRDAGVADDPAPCIDGNCRAAGQDQIDCLFDVIALSCQVLPGTRCRVANTVRIVVHEAGIHRAGIACRAR